MRHSFLSRLAVLSVVVAVVLVALAVTGRWEDTVVRPVSAIVSAVEETAATAVPEPAGQSGRPTDADAPVSGDAQLALSTLNDVRVSGARRTPSYDRRKFGPAWADVDGNGCDTRNDVLRRDLTDPTVAPNGCTVFAGTFEDPYTGQRIAFRRGVDTSARVQIDHVVPLSYAWSNGAWAWDATTRERFANDEGNLLAVDGPTNTSKGDSGPSEWMPPNHAFRCSYSARFVAVVSAYDLTITPSDRDALRHTLERCH